MVGRPVKVKKEAELPTRHSRRIAQIEKDKAKTNAKRGKRKAPGAGGRASKRGRIATFNPLPTSELAYLHLPFSFDLEKPTHNATKLYTFGTNEDGQLGIGQQDDDEFREPIQSEPFKTLLGAKKLGKNGLEDVEAAFGMHSLAIASDGKLWSFGLNDNGSLGRITDQDKATSKDKESVPALVEGLPATFRTTRICGADGATVAISDTGLVKLWGQFRANEGPIPFNGVEGTAEKQALPMTPATLAKEEISAIAAGNNHFVAVDVNGHVWTWGANIAHVLAREYRGRGAVAAGLEPRKLKLKNIVAVGACSFTSFAVDKDGQVYAWGSNAFSQTGIEEEEMLKDPTIVDALSPEQLDGAKVVQISGGEHHTLFLLDNGQVLGCGRCDDYQVGLPKAHPVMQAAFKANEEAKNELKRVNQEQTAKLQAQIAAGEIKMELQDVTLKALEFANNTVNVPPIAVTQPTKITFPDEEDGEAKIIQISVGTRQNLAVSNQGNVYSFGTGVGGQLGQGDVDAVSKPRKIKGEVEDLRIIKASAGGTHCFLLAVDKEEPEEEPEAIDAVLIVRSPGKAEAIGVHENGSALDQEMEDAPPLATEEQEEEDDDDDGNVASVVIPPTSEKRSDKRQAKSQESRPQSEKGQALSASKRSGRATSHQASVAPPSRASRKRPREEEEVGTLNIRQS